MSIQPFVGGDTPAMHDGPLAALLYDHPDDVLADGALTADEKRAILSSWASDAFAVESVPALRAPPFGRAPIVIDDILAALSALDQRLR